MWSFQHFFFKTLSVAHFIPLKSVTLYCTEMQISVQHGIKPLHGCQSKQLLEQLQMFLNAALWERNFLIVLSHFSDIICRCFIDLKYKRPSFVIRVMLMGLTE